MILKMMTADVKSLVGYHFNMLVELHPLHHHQILHKKV